jgi:hypothetical protein
VERVRHDDAVEIREIEPPREVGDADVQLGLRHSGNEGASQLGECRAISIDRVDDPVRTEQIRERKGERAGTRTEVSPRAALALRHAAREQGDMVGVVHDEPSSLSRQPSVESASVTGPSASMPTRIAVPNRP